MFHHPESYNQCHYSFCILTWLQTFVRDTFNGIYLAKGSHKRFVAHSQYKSRQFLKINRETSLVLQWLRVCLPMQGTWVRSLVQQDSTCCGAAKPVCHNYWTCALEPSGCNYWAHMPQVLKAVHPRACALQQEKPPQWEACAPQWRVAPTLCN